MNYKELLYTFESAKSQAVSFYEFPVTSKPASFCFKILTYLVDISKQFKHNNESCEKQLFSVFLYYRLITLIRYSASVLLLAIFGMPSSTPVLQGKYKLNNDVSCSSMICNYSRVSELPQMRKLHKISKYMN